MAGELFIGEAEGHLDGSGTLAIRSQRDPDLTCSGQFTSGSRTGGIGKPSRRDGKKLAPSGSTLTLIDR